MDLGIEGKTALVRGKQTGRGCAEALAAEGVNLVIVARTRDTLEETAEEIRAGANVSVTAVACDITTPDGRGPRLAACPQPDILVTNAGRRPATSATFARRLDPRARSEHADADRADPRDRRRDDRARLRPDRQHHEPAVKAPIDVLALSNGARSGLTGFVAGCRARSRAGRDDQQPVAGPVRHRPDRDHARRVGEGARRERRRDARAAHEGHPGRPPRHACGIRRGVRVPAACTPATSPGRTGCSTAARIRARSDARTAFHDNP